jgi:N-ethylmaleimide reductase
MWSQPLFTPYRMGDLNLPNRIVMAPLTRMRAQSHDHVPTALQAEYYTQRASAGLIITEATAISPEGFGWADTPGLWTEEQVRGWRRVTDAVHAAGGRMIAQLWHTGAISHPELREGAQPVSASSVDPGQLSFTRTGRKPTVTPRSLTKQEIQVTVADFARAARNAMEAGFDGVQILANYLYLISQFLNATTNLRKDEYGGSLESRSRFLFEVVESVLGEVDAPRVGVKISPMHEGGAFQANDETLPVTEYAIRKLSTYNLSHLLLMGNTTDFSGTPLEKLAGDGMFQHFRPLFNGTLIANVKMDRDRGNRLIAEGLADLVAFGRPYIANPDLVQRFAENAPLAEVDWETVYAAGPRGYSDYPTYQSSEYNPRSLIMPKTTPEQNKAIVLKAFETLFNKRDYKAAERFWSPTYIQHSAHIAPGREGLFNLVRSAPNTLRYENQLIVAEGDYVIAHGRFSGNGRPAPWIAADVIRFEDGLLAEHWDVLQDEATEGESLSGLPMFGDRFPA